jgi:hypothetical protein
MNPLCDQVAYRGHEFGMGAYRSGTDEVEAELLRNFGGLGVEVVLNLHMVGQESYRGHANTLHPFLAEVPDTIADIRLEPRLRGRAAAALKDHLPVRDTDPPANQPRCFPELLDILAASGHDRGDAVSGIQDFRGISVRRIEMGQSVRNPVGHGTDEACVVEKRSDLVYLGRVAIEHRSSGFDVFPVLTATRVRAEG